MALLETGPAMTKVERLTVELSAYPGHVVILLGMRVNRWFGLRTLLRIGPHIRRPAAQRPDGLLLHEDLLFSLRPMHLDMRQYWRDFDALEAYARSSPHRDWWTSFLRASVVPVRPARGPMFSARERAGGSGAPDAVVPEHVLYRTE